MDPCPFVRINIGNLALTFPAEARPSSSASFYCKIRLTGKFSTQFSTVPVIQKADGVVESRVHACYNLKKPELERILELLSAKGKPCALRIEVYAENNGVSCLNGGKRLGSVLVVPLDLKGLETSVSSSRGFVFQSGWVSIPGSAAMLHLNVKAEPDPRFVFQFDGEPECSPQVFQVNGNVKQPVFSCKFSFRNCGDRTLRSRSSYLESSTSRRCFSASDGKEKAVKERKGWSITIHDLSGSPVAAASMVTPFVPSPGSDRVSRSNPGAWLILRPGDGTWKPWGRLEAWRECSGAGDSIGFRFELIPDGATDTITLVKSSICLKNGGKFSIDMANGPTPLTSPNSSFDFSLGSGSDLGSAPGSGSWACPFYGGFVMSSTVGGDGKCCKPEVEIGVQHVTCAEDAAAFVALSAAMDLSVDACRSFSQKLRKELRQSDQE